MAAGYSEVGEYGRPFVLVTEDTQEQIQEEIRLGDMELVAQLVEAEAGNQSFEGKYEAVAVEYELHSNKEVLYFNNCSIVGGTGTPFKVGGHWFNS